MANYGRDKVDHFKETETLFVDVNSSLEQKLMLDHQTIRKRQHNSSPVNAESSTTCGYTKSKYFTSDASQAPPFKHTRQEYQHQNGAVQIREEHTPTRYNGKTMRYPFGAGSNSKLILFITILVSSKG